MIRVAHAHDGEKIAAFLKDFPESSMFLRSNLAQHGIGPGDHPHATEFWIVEDEDRMVGVFGLTMAGFLVCQMPQVTPLDWQIFAAMLEGRDVAGMTGDDSQVRAALTALALPEDAFALNAAEPLYRLDLVDLRTDAEPLRVPVAADADLLTDWFAGYALHTGMQRDEIKAARFGRERAERAIDNPAIGLLTVGDAPVAMSALIAEADAMVQVGAVFVPRTLRNRGYGRRVVAAQMHDCRARGISAAVLSANNRPAARAYEAIGFRRIGQFRVAILATPHRMAGPA